MQRLRKIVNFRQFSLPFALYRVEGQSMAPGLTPGQMLIGWRWGRPKVGQVVVVRHNLPLVKRVAALDVEGIWLLGDNQAVSTDSRQLGHVNAELIDAIVVWPFVNKPKATLAAIRYR